MNKYTYLQPFVGKPMKYKELCKVIGLPPQDGARNKEMQLKQLSQYVQLERHDGRIIIIKIYDDNEIELLEKEGKFTTYIENELIRILSNCTEPQISLSYREIITELEMANKEYWKAKSQPYNYVNEFTFKVPLGSSEVMDAHEIIQQDMTIFFDVSKKQYETIIKNALLSMRRRGLILFSETFRLCDKSTNMLHDCNPEETQNVLNIRYEIMQKFNLKTMQDMLFLSKLDTQVFWNEFSARLKEKTGYDYCIPTFTLTLSDEGLKKEYNKLLYIGQLNRNVQEKFLNTKELKCLHDVLLKQFVKKFVEKF